jgi:LmbE family N-acetylglucosaminyl deacetylase
VPDSPLTMMAVHAHPDDEASTTGGLFALCANQGIRTVLVTCTDGALGDDRGGVKPGTDGHDRERVVATRRAELAASCRILGVDVAVDLGYRDSGMMGWADNDAPGSFWLMDVETAAAPLVNLFEQYQPQVVVTYDANGFYGHPDHIQAHRITLAAAERTGIPSKVYFPTFPHSSRQPFVDALRDLVAQMSPDDAGDEAPEGPPEEFGTPDEEISAWLDCSAVVETKRRSLLAHQSQIESTIFMRLAPERFAQLFGIETYLRHLDRTGTPVPETDLFAGLR